MDEQKDNFTIKLVDLLLSVKVWILILFIIISIVAINYNFSNEGVVISGVIPGSAAQKSGVEFDSSASPTSFEQILYLDTTKINTQEDYFNYISKLDKNSSFLLITNKEKKGYNIDLNKLNDKNKSIDKLIGLSLSKKAKSNIRLGIELEGGSRLILKPQTNLSKEEYNMLIENLQNRLDVYGASGTKVNKLEDAFTGDKFVIVESISSNKNDILELISRQGKFSAKVGNKTVFTGDNVINVFTDPSHAGLQSCTPDSTGQYVCSFAFSIEIDKQGGDNFFAATSALSSQGQYLSKKVCFNLDSQEITCLNIASTFKYNRITTPQITVTGNPAPTKAKAIESGKKEMKFLQTILSTQSLPTKLEVVQSYSISSSEGAKLLSNALIVGLMALLLVASVVALRYRHFIIFASILTALLSEVIIVFGVAAFMRLSIDLSAIGGLIASIGTGVDDQIIITDEYFRKRDRKLSSKKKIKAAFFIIMISYITTVAAMVPLYFAGLKILQGFAFMIIIGVTIGVFVTRPAYAAILRIMMTSRRTRREEAEEDKL